jgi:uncharacterized protein YndB with AHSA1/START domain
MKPRSVTHDTFVIERVYDATPARVFAAFADPEIKYRWFSAPEEWVREKSRLDFRVGGHEHAAGGPKGGPVHRYAATYMDIVPNERIVSVYEMYMDDTRTSVSVATFEFKKSGEGTRLVLTEQGVFLDGLDIPGERERGTKELLDQLGKMLAQPA